MSLTVSETRHGLVASVQGMGVHSEAVAELMAGRPVVLWCAGPAWSVGLLIAAGRIVTARTMAFLVRHCSGLVCVTVAAEECVRLGLPAMPLVDEFGLAVQMRVTVDAAEGIGTGISAHDRARTARLLSDPAAQRNDFTRPGHMVPIRVESGSAFPVPAQRVADLIRAAGLGGSGVYSHLVTPDGLHLADRESATDFSVRHRLTFVEQEIS